MGASAYLFSQEDGQGEFRVDEHLLGKNGPGADSAQVPAAPPPGDRQDRPEHAVDQVKKVGAAGGRADQGQDGGGEETDAETRQHEPRPPREGWARARGRPG